jgi:hypothetical protein
MVTLMSLWLPVLLSAVAVFLASSVVHMVLPLHSKDYSKLPNEGKLLEAMRNEGVAPGDYAFPCPDDKKDMGSPEMLEKLKQGPVGFMTVAPSGSWNMGSSLAQWFVFSLVIGVLVAYVTSRTVAPGADYLQVFRIAGVVAFIGYAGAHPVASIWGKRKWSTTVKFVFDGLIYGVLTGGFFGWLWPGA